MGRYDDFDGFDDDLDLLRRRSGHDRGRIPASASSALAWPSLGLSWPLPLR